MKQQQIKISSDSSIFYSRIGLNFPLKGINKKKPFMITFYNKLILKTKKHKQKSYE